MQIPVNKNIDFYKDDFWKGLTLSQTVSCILTLCAGTGTFLFLSGPLGVPETAALYLTFPVAFPFAATGFLKIGGMGIGEYLKKRRACVKMPLYHFHPMCLAQEKEGSPPQQTNPKKHRKEAWEYEDAGLQASDGKIV